MGRTDQVLTGGSLSEDQPKNNHESRLRPSPRLSHTNLFCGGTRKYWQRRKSFAAKGSERCCKRKNTTMSRRNVQTGMKKNRQRNPKKGGKGRKGQRTAKGEPKRKRPGK